MLYSLCAQGALIQRVVPRSMPLVQSLQCSPSFFVLELVETALTSLEVAATRPGSRDSTTLVPTVCLYLGSERAGSGASHSLLAGWAPPYEGPFKHRPLKRVEGAEVDWRWRDRSSSSEAAGGGNSGAAEVGV